jgi:D-amino-acid dehydrogenase
MPQVRKSLEPSHKGLRVLIIGAGLIGVTSAYSLRRRGHEVVVIDRESGPGRETSFANGSLLTPSMPEPWNAPGCWRTLLASLGRTDSPMQLRIKALPGLTRWGLRFLRNSSTARYQRNAIRNHRLALYSLKMMASIRDRAAIEYGRTARGTLRLFRDSAALNHAWTSNPLASEGLTSRRLTREQTLELEPALAPIAGQFTGAIHYPIDETGDAHRFCRALAEQAQREGVQFRFGTEVTSIEIRSGRVTSVMGAGERFEADTFLVAAASYSTPLLKRAGIDLPVQPVKGYSVTFDLPPETNSLRIPIIDDDLHAVVVPLEGAIRVAGTAEFAGYDRSSNPARIRNLLKLLQQILPQLPVDPERARSWCGLRPMSPDGVPIIGPTALSNLFVNTGHGPLGWTMAAGSAELLADLMDGRPAAVDPACYDLKRFA